MLMNLTIFLPNYCCIKIVDIPKYSVPLHSSLNNAEAQGCRQRDGNLYIGKAFL